MLNSSDYHRTSDSTDWMYQGDSITSSQVRQPFLKCIWDSEANNFKDIATHSSQYLFCDVKTLILYPPIFLLSKAPN